MPNPIDPRLSSNGDPARRADADVRAIAAARAHELISDRRDARDGVDPSDTLPADPDAVGGTPPATRRHRARRRNQRR
ncbi:MAG: hypothetical protein K8W52_22130 [Deltaproteobacteria bacterium]|nr:hypothetical protein [Deltaproteobacteria bacterium]